MGLRIFFLIVILCYLPTCVLSIVPNVWLKRLQEGTVEPPRQMAWYSIIPGELSLQKNHGPTHKVT